MKLSIYEQNVAFIRELLPEKQWAAEMWLAECDRLNYRFKISEAYRTQARQNALYAQGRTKPGPVVTWTRDSNHTKRLAVDVYPINCSHRDIESIAVKYGIAHPWPKEDPPHYSLDKAVSKPTPNIPKTAAAAERRLERELHKAKEPRKSRLLARKEGLRSR